MKYTCPIPSFRARSCVYHRRIFIYPYSVEKYSIRLYTQVVLSIVCVARLDSFHNAWQVTRRMLFADTIADLIKTFENWTSYTNHTYQISPLKSTSRACLPTFTHRTRVAPQNAELTVFLCGNVSNACSKQQDLFRNLPSSRLRYKG